MIDIEVELTAYHQVGCKTSNNSGANITYKCLQKTIQHNIEYEETYLQGYFEFRLCPHNTRRRPAQQARSKQSQNLKQRNTLNVKQENKINVSIDLKHTQTNKRCPVPFLFIVVPKSFPAIQFLSLYLTVLNRVVLTSTSLEERAVVFVFFHFLLNKLAAGQSSLSSVIKGG